MLRSACGTIASLIFSCANLSSSALRSALLSSSLVILTKRSGVISPLRTRFRNDELDLFLRFIKSDRIFNLYSLFVSEPNAANPACSTDAAQANIVEGAAVERKQRPL